MDWRDLNGNGMFDVGEFVANDGSDVPESQGWWVDADGGIWLATRSMGLRLSAVGTR